MKNHMCDNSNENIRNKVSKSKRWNYGDWTCDLHHKWSRIRVIKWLNWLIDWSCTSFQKQWIICQFWEQKRISGSKLPSNHVSHMYVIPFQPSRRVRARGWVWVGKISGLQAPSGLRPGQKLSRTECKQRRYLCFRFLRQNSVGFGFARCAWRWLRWIFARACTGK